MRRPVGLAVLLIGYFSLVEVFPLLIYAHFAYRLNKKLVESNVEQAHLLNAQSLSGELELLVDEMEKLMRRTVDTADQIEAGEDSSAYQILSSDIQRFPAFRKLVIVDESERALFTLPPDPALIGADASREGYSSTGLRTGEAHWSDSYFSPRDGKPTLFLAVHGVARTAVGFLDLEPLSALVNKRNFGRRSAAGVVDRSGVVIAHTDPILVQQGENLGGRASIQAALGGTEGSFHEHEWEEKILRTVAVVPQTRWVVFIQQPEKEAFASVRQFTSIAYSGVLLLVASTIIIMIILQRWIARPIKQLVQSAGRLRAGEHQAGPLVKGYSQIRALDVAFREMSRAITERERALQQSESRYRELVQQAASLILRWSADGRIVFLNEYGRMIFGYEDNEILGRSLFDTIIFREEGVTNALEHMVGEIAADPDRIVVHEATNRTKSGRRLLIQWTNRGIFDEHGRLKEVFAVGTDVTERRQLEEKLRRSQSLEHIGQMAAGLAHEFNNALMIIIGRCDVLMGRLEQGMPPRRDIELIKETALRIAKVIDRFLAFSQQQSLQLAACDLNSFVVAEKKEVAGILGERIVLELALAEALEPVLADRERLRQVLRELAANALAAMPEGGRLTVETARQELSREEAQRLEIQSGVYGVLTVRDTGKGMDQITLGSLFQPYFSTQEFVRSAGLGLAFVYGFIRQSKGGLAVSSTPGAGTRFSLYLPLYQEPR